MRLPRVAAILAPLLVFALVGAALLRPEPPVDADRPNPGTPQSRTLDERITSAGGVDVVLLGNSKVGTDLDPDAIGRLFPNGASVVPLGVKGTGMPVWYTVLHDRVYAAGYQPKLIIVYGTLAMMVQTALPSDAQRVQLRLQVTTPNPVLDTKVYGKAMADPQMQLAQARRSDWHRSLLDGTRNLAVGLLLAPPGESDVAERGRAYAEPALASLFSTANQKEAKRHVGPVVEQELTDSGEERRVLDTLIPDLFTLAHSHGAQVLFIRAPLAQSRRSVDAVPAAVEPEVVALLRQVGAGYLDLREVDLSPSAYGDGVHLSSAGRARFMPQLLEAVKQVGVGTGSLVAAEPSAARVPFTASRSGAPPVLGALVPHRTASLCGYSARFTELPELEEGSLLARDLGSVSPVVVLEDSRPLRAHANTDDTAAACSGAAYFVDGRLKFSPTGPGPESADRHQYTVGLSEEVPLVGGEYQPAWWVYPGTTLTLQVDHASPRVRVEAVPVREGAQVPTMRVDGESTGAVEAEFTSFGHRLGATVETFAGAGPQTLSITSPPDGPWLLLDRVVIGTPEAPVYLVGKARHTEALALLSVATAITAADPPRLPGPLATPHASRDGKLWLFDVSRYGVPSHDEAATVAGSGCSPLTLLVDGTPLDPERGADHKPMNRVTHSGGTLKVTFGDGRDPRDGAHAYTVQLDPSRTCGKRHARWLYPGDDLTLTLGPEVISALVRGATTLDLGGAALPAGRPGSLFVSLLVDGVETFTTTLDLAAFPSPPLVLPERVSPNASSVVVRLRLDSATGYVLLTTADLVEPTALPLGE